MRTVTRNLVLALLAVLGALLALGAVPGTLRWGDPYYLTATPADDRPAIDANDLPERRFPYATAALANATADEAGRSHPYWRGPVGLKGAFTHSPFDELDALAGRQPNATEGDAVFARHEGSVYRLTVTREVAA